MSLEETRALVTGASRGIGRRIAVRLAEEGASVALLARSEGIHGTAELIGEETRALPLETDVSDEGDVRRAVARTVEAFGGLDCAVNNAGIAGPTAPVEEIDREEWDRTLGVNVTGAFLVAKHAAGPLRESPRGRIVNPIPTAPPTRPPRWR